MALRTYGAKDYLVYFVASLVVLAGLFGIYDDVAVSAGGVNAAAGAQASLSQLPRPFAGVQRMHLVLIGADDRPGEVGRSDTLMVLWLNPERQRAAIMSIPRDLRVDIPHHGSTKVNHAYAYGGAPLTTATVEQFLGVRVDGFVKVNFEGFVKAVDTLGGVDLMVPDIEGENRGMNYDDNWGNLHIHLTPGRHHLGGYEAMGFCRYRKSNYHGLGDGDGGRAARQQQFIKAIVEQKLRVSELPGLLKAGRQLMGCVETNLAWRQCVDLARLLKQMGQADIKTVTIPVVDAPSGGVYYSQVVESAFRNMLAEVDQHLDSDTAAVCKVEVLNGSGVPGMAKTAAEALTQGGFQVVQVGNAETQSFDATRVRYVSGQQSTATSAAMVLGVGKPEPLGSDDAGPAPLQVIVGKDYQEVLGTSGGTSPSKTSLAQPKKEE